ncbi:hypothetical protein KV580_12890 [Pseudomonas chlororaphis]|nr:hypothetical protein [Pseudomonas chlororaphis]
MTTETIDHSTLTRLVETGSVNAAHIVGQQGGWEVQVTCGALDHTLTAQRSRQVRLFKKFETLVTYLQGVGINHFDVDASSYDPLTVKTYGRPDRSAALKQVHEAAAYDEWFKTQVQASIDDPRPSISDEDARQLFAAKREALRKRAHG